jgi:hypothetical protein
VSMAAGGYTPAEVEDSVREMIKRHAAKGASIAPEHRVEVQVCPADEPAVTVGPLCDAHARPAGAAA